MPGSQLVLLLGEQTWEGALAWAVLLALVSGMCLTLPEGRWRVVGLGAREAAIVMSLLSLWRYVGHYVRLRVDGGMENGRTVWDVERVLHLPSEVWVQSLTLPHPDLVRVLNLYYMSMHLTSMAVFLAWMWWRYRDQYPKARTLVALSTLLSLLVQLVPVAPPRMYPDLGFVDTAQEYGQSVYGWGGSAVGSQLAAMPSVHVLWALILAWFAWRIIQGPVRYLFLGHAALTVVVVVATANHWWLDGIVAGGLMVIVLLAQWAFDTVVVQRRAGAAVPVSAAEDLIVA